MRDFLYPIRVLHGKLHQYTLERKCLVTVRERICSVDRNAVLFVMTPTHGNLGDHAIAVAVSQMLKELNVTYAEITADELKLMQKHNKMHIMNGYPILVNGGGNIGTLWMSVERMFRAVIRHCPDSPILCLPNTAFFDETEQGRHEYEQSRRIYRSHGALTICARERISYEVLSRLHDRVKLIPDMALSLNECRPGVQRKGCLLCLRSDREKTRDDHADELILEQTARLFGSNVINSDMNIGKPIPVGCRAAELSKKYDIFRSAELVITDRLHGMIFAAITGTPCIVINSKSPKVQGCYEWVRELGYIRFAEDASDITQEYHRIGKLENAYSNDHLQQYYQELKSCITDLLKL